MNYARWLGLIDNETGLTYAELMAQAVGEMALAGDISAAREIRQATEGDRLNAPDVFLTDRERIERVMGILEQARQRRLEAEK